MPFTITSTSFKHNGVMPSRYTCDGQNVSPPLVWTGVPETAKSLVLIVDDPDAPDPKAPKMTWVHWILYNIPPGAAGLPEAIPGDSLPPGTRQGKNDWQTIGYRGPCPPVGMHHYLHKLYALDIVLPDLMQPTKAGLETMIHGYVIAHTELVGRYARQH